VSGLANVSTATVEQLLRALQAKRLRPPFSGLALSAAGVRLCDEAAVWVTPLSPDALAAACEAVLAERGTAGAKVELVWSGPEVQQGGARHTSLTVAELFTSARQEVLVAGYRFDHGAEILRPLHRVMVDHGVGVTLILDVPPAKGRGVQDQVEIAIDQFLHKNWPFGDPKPTVYVDPRTSAVGSMASMHAKCIIIDQQRVLVGSANFTNRGQHRNVEVGALIDSPSFSKQLLAQWNALITEGALSPS
jgi:phosphatidylserine/phosphatidylglycerophosphate/cardiolipin synthase-like enzyme